MKMRAAVLEEFGEPLVVQEVELAEPEGGRGAGPARRLRRLPHRPLHGLGRRPVRLRADGARPRGRRRRRGGRRGRRPRSRRATTSSPSSRRSAASASTAVDPRTNLCLAIREQQNKGYLPDGTTRLLARRRADPPLHGHLDLRRVHGDAGDRAREDRPRGAARPRLPVRLRPLDRARRGDQHRQGRAGLDLRRLRRRHGRPRRGRRLPAAGRRADRLRRPLRGAARAGPRPGRDRDDDRRRGRGRARSSR